MLVTNEVRMMMQQGKTRDEINAALQTYIMPGMVKFQRDALGVFNAVLNDLTAPSLSLN
jgi:hypothetical protein